MMKNLIRTTHRLMILIKTFLFMPLWSAEYFEISSAVGFTVIANSVACDDFMRSLWTAKVHKVMTAHFSTGMDIDDGQRSLQKMTVCHGCSTPITDHPVCCLMYLPTSGALSPGCQISIIERGCCVQGDACVLMVWACASCGQNICHTWAKGMVYKSCEMHSVKLQGLCQLTSS